MLKPVRLAQPYKIKTTYSEVKEMSGQLEIISKQDGKSGFSVSELRKAKEFVRHHGIRFQMNEGSIGTLQDTLAHLMEDYKPHKDRFSVSFYAYTAGGSNYLYFAYSFVQCLRVTP
jgi:hypothetical protein